MQNLLCIMYEKILLLDPVIFRGNYPSIGNFRRKPPHRVLLNRNGQQQQINIFIENRNQKDSQSNQRLMLQWKKKYTLRNVSISRMYHKNHEIK